MNKLHRFSHLHYATTNKLVAISTDNAIKSLRELYKDYSDESTIIQNAFKIYDQVTPLKNAKVIAALLKLCLTYNNVDKSASIWDDMKEISLQPQEPENVTAYLLFMKCSTKSNNIDINKCIETLELIRDCPFKICQEYDLKDYSISTNKIISQCKDNIDKISIIHELINDIKIDDVYIKTALINAYGKCGDIPKALDVFNSINNAKKDSPIMNTMMKWLIKQNQHETALVVYDEYIWLQDDVSHILALKACIHLNYLDKGEIIHEQITKNSDINLKNALIDFYGHFGDINNALDVFNHIDENEKDKISVGSIMKCLVNSGRYKDGLELYDQYDTLHDDKTHQFAVKACTYTDNFEKGKKIRSKIQSNTDPYINATLIDFYGNFGSILTAIKIFKSIPDRKKDIQTVAAMMDAYCKSDMNVECLDLFKKMSQKHEPDLICYVIALKACAQGTAYHFGIHLHEKLKENKSLNWILSKSEIQVGFINFYGKCGELDICERIFKESENPKDIALWNAMINAYGRNGNSERSKELLFNLLKSGVMPDIHTFIFLIAACGHCGDIDDAKVIWEEAISDKDIKYNRYVMTALIDCLARYGRFEEAKQLINEYEEFSKNLHDPMWMALLSGCSKEGNISMAEYVHNEMKDRFKGKNDKIMRAASVVLSNIYGATSEFDKKREIRENISYKGWSNPRSVSEIDINGEIYRFNAGMRYRDEIGCDSKKLDERLEQIVSLLKEKYGFEHDYKCITRDLDNDGNESKEFVLCRHSEKLALVYGVLNTSKDYQIVINKNARICNDCHNFIRLASKMEDRKLIVSDPNRVHIFENGKCNCNEYY